MIIKESANHMNLWQHITIIVYISVDDDMSWLRSKML